MPPKSTIEMTGKKFSRLTVISEGKKGPYGATMWNCVCDCGAKTLANGSKLRSGNLESCGCLLRESVTKHGLSGVREYKTWKGMIQRCDNPNDAGYPGYGGRGIKVCVRWKKSFADFFADMGSAPSKAHSIDRIDNDKGYSPDNCRWATVLEQQSNRRSNVLFEHDSLRLCISEWARRLRIPVSTIHNRLQRGWAIKDAILTPSRSLKAKS